MQVSVTFRHIEATEALRVHAERRVQRIAKYVHRPVDAHVVLSVTKRRHVAEIVLNADRTTLTATEQTGDLYSAIDLAADKLEHQARKHTSKMKSHKVPAPVARRRTLAVVPPPATETLSVVYRRKDGNYGLIAPEAS